MNASASAFSFIMLVVFLVFALLAIPIASIGAGDGSQRWAALRARPGGGRRDGPCLVKGSSRQEQLSLGSGYCYVS